MSENSTASTTDVAEESAVSTSEVSNAAVNGSHAEVDERRSAAVDDESADDPTDAVSLLVQEGDIAGDYLERLLDIVDYDGDIDLDVENGRAIVAVIGGNELKPLVGPRGVTLDALQELTRLAVAQQTGVRSRLMLDVGGYRADRRTELTELAQRTAGEVVNDGESRTLVPMNAFERKVVHDAIAAVAGVFSESEGEDPRRRVTVRPAS